MTKQTQTKLLTPFALIIVISLGMITYCPAYANDEQAIIQSLEDDGYQLDSYKLSYSEYPIFPNGDKFIFRFSDGLSQSGIGIYDMKLKKVSKTYPFDFITKGKRGYSRPTLNKTGRYVSFIHTADRDDPKGYRYEWFKIREEYTWHNAYRTFNQTLYILDLQTGIIKEYPLKSEQEYVSYFVNAIVSPDGERVAFTAMVRDGCTIWTKKRWESEYGFYIKEQLKKSNFDGYKGYAPGLGSGMIWEMNLTTGQAKGLSARGLLEGHSNYFTIDYMVPYYSNNHTVRAAFESVREDLKIKIPDHEWNQNFRGLCDLNTNKTALENMQACLYKTPMSFTSNKAYQSDIEKFKDIHLYNHKKNKTITSPEVVYFEYDRYSSDGNYVIGTIVLPYNDPDYLIGNTDVGLSYSSVRVLGGSGIWGDRRITARNGPYLRVMTHLDNFKHYDVADIPPDLLTFVPSNAYADGGRIFDAIKDKYGHTWQTKIGLSTTYKSKFALYGMRLGNHHLFGFYDFQNRRLNYVNLGLLENWEKTPTTIKREQPLVFPFLGVKWGIINLYDKTRTKNVVRFEYPDEFKYYTP